MILDKTPKYGKKLSLSFFNVRLLLILLKYFYSIRSRWLNSLINASSKAYFSPRTRRSPRYPRRTTRPRRILAIHSGCRERSASTAQACSRSARGSRKRATRWSVSGATSPVEPWSESSPARAASPPRRSTTTKDSSSSLSASATARAARSPRQATSFSWRTKTSFRPRLLLNCSRGKLSSSRFGLWTSNLTLSLEGKTCSESSSQFL